MIHIQTSLLQAVTNYLFQAYIDSVRQILDPNPMPPGLYQYSIVISTPQREMKFTAPTKERHEIWLNVSYISIDAALTDTDTVSRL